jgi:predicted nucleotidyltransferase
MRTDLDHLPPAKQRELERVVQILFEEFDEAIARATQEWKRKGRILRIILYGSYARGNWVDEPHTAKGYQSDFDLLVIVNDKRRPEVLAYVVCPMAAQPFDEQLWERARCMMRDNVVPIAQTRLVSRRRCAGPLI